MSRRARESLAAFCGRIGDGRDACPDCDGYGEVIAGSYPASADEPGGYTTHPCVECWASGWVEADPLEGADDGPEAEPDAAPLSLLGQVAMAASVLGIGLGEAARLCREVAS